MTTEYSLLVIIIAGIMNASFVVPARFIKIWPNNYVWLCHSIIGLGVLPWFFLLFSDLNSVLNYTEISAGLIIFVLFSGLAFGAGQVGFAYAIEYVGIGISFAINLGVGTAIGSLYLLVSSGQLFSKNGFVVLIAILFILLSLFTYYVAGYSNQKPLSSNEPHRAYCVGWVFGSLAGITSGLQNIVFVMVAFYQPSGTTSESSFWVWPPFLFMASLSMSAGFMHRLKAQKNIITEAVPTYTSLKAFSLIGLMGIFFSGSLFLYSYAMSHFNADVKVIGWPLFMSIIIMTTQFYDILFKTKQGKYSILRFLATLFLIMAVVLLTLVY